MDIKNWLEAAKRFNQIDPAKTTEQQLISTFPGYNFDMSTTADVQYEIDVTQPVGSRIKNLTYLGRPSMRRAGVRHRHQQLPRHQWQELHRQARRLGHHLGLADDANRDVVIDYIREEPRREPHCQRRCQELAFAKATVAGPVVFTSGQRLSVAQAAGLAT